ERLPDLEWNHPSESIRQLAARSKGAVVKHGDRSGMWKLAEQDDQKGEHIDGGDSPSGNGESPTLR
ncbi:MAG TPA: hypothetical protein VMY87_06510, partial [Armatimonadota bacterium]|nr:hypothetical protein [Armatimonadota bacterium]